MPRKAAPPPCSENDRQTLKEWAKSRSMEARLVERARMMCKLLDGESINKVANDLKVRPNTVIDWRDRFAAHGIAGLHDRPRSGKPPKYGLELRTRVLQTLELPPLPASPVGMVRHWPSTLTLRSMRFGGYCGNKTSAWLDNEAGASAPLRSFPPKPPTLSDSIWRRRKRLW